MLQIIIVLLTAIIISVLFDYKVHSVLPILLMGEMLFAYVFALFIPNLTVAIISALAVPLFFLCVIYFTKREFLRRGVFKDNVLTPQFFICILTCVLWAALYSNHYVYFWDDMSYICKRFILHKQNSDRNRELLYFV